MSGFGVRRRLTNAFTAWTLAALLAALLGLRQVARQALFAEHEGAVARSGALVQSFFRAELAEYRHIEGTVAHIAGELVFAGTGIEFVRPDGTTFAVTRQPPDIAQPRPPLVRYTQPLEASLAPGWQLRLTISTADLERARWTIDRATLLAVPLAVLLAALLAWWVTGRALAPVASMASAANRLQDTAGERLPIANATDEFGRLGGAFNGLLDRLDRVLKDQQRFLADAAHELRTPVARLRGAAEARLSDSPSPRDREALEEIAEELGQTSTLIDQLLFLARSESGALTPERADVFLDDIASDAVTRAARSAAARQLTLDAEGLTETRVTGDPGMLARVATILVDNAIRFTPPGGTIKVATQRADDCGRLIVEDSGIGVDASERSMIFERFMRGRRARQVAPDGSGLGLAIARTIAEAHGGTVAVDSSDLGGARFTLRLPA